MADNTVVQHPAADPSHPDHKAFNWGKFLAILALALEVSAPLVSAEAPSHPKIGATLAGAGQVLGTIDQALLASQQ